MNRKILIVGAGGHGRSVAEALIAADVFSISGFVDDGCISDAVLGLPVLGKTADLYHLNGEATHAIVAIGKNDLREDLCNQVLAAGFQLATVIHPRAIVSPSARIAAGCTVMAGAVVGACASLGFGVIVNSGAVVDHDSIVMDYGHLGVGACMAGGAVLGRAAWMQSGVALGYGVRIPAGVILPPGYNPSHSPELATGNPPRN